MKSLGLLIPVIMVLSMVTGCAPSSGEPTIYVSIGYQSRTLNTATAGTLLRDLGYFEAALDEIGRKEGKRYKVTWNDFSSGAPITAKMLAGQVDIGSMGDFPLLINAFRTSVRDDSATELVAVTAYSRTGALNGIVVPTETKEPALTRDEGLQISTSLGSAGHGLLLRAIDAGLIPSDVAVINQDPAVGAASVKSNKVDALAQFAPWPALLTYRGDARLAVDGGLIGRPTFHGVVARKAYAQGHPEVVEAFVSSVAKATRFLQGDHLAAAKKVAVATGLPLDVVYLYLGTYGLATFATGLEPFLIDDLRDAQAYLRTVVPDLHVDVDEFLNPGPANNAHAVVPEQTQTDQGPVPSEVLFRDGTIASFDTVQMLVDSLNAGRSWGKVSSFYISDAQTSTRWFGANSTFVVDRKRKPDDQLLAFATPTTAGAYVASHPGSHVIALSHLQVVP